jgi:UDP-N-acetyl-D-glucosamine dehydrogenase
LVYSPEREDPGNPRYSTQTIPKVVGGITQSCLESGIALYESIIDKVIPVSTTRAAEMTKLLENIYRSVNIAMVNELKILADKMNIDLWEVIDAAATKPFGFQPFYPGPGLGGHCIPIDPFYLSWKAKEYGIPTRFIELSGEINGAMPDYVVSQAAELLNNNRKCINGSKILLIGMAYKRDVDDLRESPALRILDRLQRLGGNVSYYDPYIPALPPLRNYNFDLKSTELTPEILTSSDIVIIVTDHSCIDYQMIRQHAPIILDTRNALKRFGVENE